MLENDPDFDPSIVLLPANEFRSPSKSRGNTILYLSIAFGVLLSVSTVLAIAWRLVQIKQSRAMSATVTGQADAASLRNESVLVFTSFDEAQDRLKTYSPEESRERDDIFALFRQLEKCATTSNVEEFRTLVDFDRQLRRVELTTNLRGWSDFEKRTIRTQMKNLADLESFWGKLKVAGIVAPTDDPNSRILYAYARSGESMEATEYRFWIGRVGKGWKIYDWERLDLGLSESQKWGVYVKYFKTPEIAGFERWNVLIAEADKLIGDNQRDAAIEKLRTAESQPVPDEFQGYHWLLTGHRWFALNEKSEAERCYRSVQQPDDTPGVYFGLTSCTRDAKPAEAVKYVDQYEAAVGPTPDSLETKARLLEEIGSKAESIAEWKKLLRIEPANHPALIAVFESLPKDDKSSFDEFLERIEDPIAAVESLAPSIGYRDYPGLLQLVRFMERRAPNAAGTACVKGLSKFLDGQYREAAASYRRAYELQADDEKRSTYIYSYVEAKVADGDIQSLWNDAPDPKAAFDDLFGSYDEGEIEVTEDEYQQALATYRQRFPDDLGGLQREAQLALTQEKFDLAETLIRQGLERAQSKDGDADGGNYQDEFASSLATVLFKNGKVQAAYDSLGDRKDAVGTLFRHAVADERWDDLRTLLDVHRAKNPDDPQLHYAEGELAAHGNQWDDAIKHLQEAKTASDEVSKWQTDYQLRKAYFDSGRWLEYYKSAEDRSAAFEEVCRKLAGDENWEALSTLIAEHANESPDDILIDKYRAQAAWAAENYELSARHAQKLLQHKGEHAVSSYERKGVEERLLSSLLRSKQIGPAQQFAEACLREQNNSEYMAIMAAATRDLSQAKRWAQQTAKQREDAMMLYSNADMGPVFIGPEFAELQREFPVALRFDTSSILAVFLLDQPMQLDVATISATLKDLDLESTAAPRPIESLKKTVTSAFMLPVDAASVSLVTGNGKYFDQPRLLGSDAATRQAFEKRLGWLMVGVSGWSESDRKQAEGVAQRLAVRLAGGHSAFFWARGHELWQGFGLYPATPELLSAWQPTRNLDAFKSQHVSLTEMGQAEIASKRQFKKSMHDAVRQFESSPNGQLEVLACIGENSLIDPLWLKVEKVRRTYGGLEFDGVLKNTSTLVPLLRENLSMTFDTDRIAAWRSNGEEPTYRFQAP